MTVLVDSDILIEVFRGRDHAIVSAWTRLSESANIVMYSPVSEAELWAGARGGEHESLTRLLQILLCATIDKETGHKAGGFLSQYAKSHGVKLGDALIAAGAVLNGAVLWTRNRKHYPMNELAFY